jgi:hypothetical protein
MACHTQEEIAEAVGLNATDKALRISGNPEELPKNQKSAADHLTDFDPPIYNVHLLLGQADRIQVRVAGRTDDLGSSTQILDLRPYDFRTTLPGDAKCLFYMASPRGFEPRSPP